ncbi:MAG: nucleotidyltransferase domain-containing protein [Actinobacteria bacterium]|nr:nucleotidyltransferase domain-containing protein [Actinomycetota bacterium]
MDENLNRVIEANIKSIIDGYCPEKIILHGSFARGDWHEGSDLDLIIIKETTDRFGDRIEKVLHLCPGGIAVEPLVYTAQEIRQMLAEGNDFLRTALERGVVVYDREHPGGSKMVGTGQV